MTNQIKGAANPVSVAVFMVLLLADGGLYYFKVIGVVLAVVIFVLSLFVFGTIRIADQWERAVVLRMGKYRGLNGPGLFFIVPIIDRVVTYIDQRIRVTEFKAEETLTKDTVPTNVDAVVYWTIWDAEKAALEVQDYASAVAFIAQTGLRDIIGQHELADLLQHREKIGEALQVALDQHTNPWGITCQTVGIRDIVIPAALADAMSKQAQAERERQARIILGTAETEISEKFSIAARNYRNDPIALHLRGMNMLFEGLKEKGSLVIVPSSALDSMNLGAISGLAALAGGAAPVSTGAEEAKPEPEESPAKK
jgi:hypothetical protein